MEVREVKALLGCLMLLFSLLAFTGCGRKPNLAARNQAVSTEQGPEDGSDFNIEGIPEDQGAVLPELTVPHQENLEITIPDNSENRTLGEQIDYATVKSTPNNGPIEVRIKTKDNKTLTFSGRLNAKDKSWSGTLEATTPDQGYKLQANCVDANCEHGDLVLQDEKGAQAGLSIDAGPGAVGPLPVSWPDLDQTASPQSARLSQVTIYPNKKTTTVILTEDGKEPYVFRSDAKKKDVVGKIRNGFVFSSNRNSSSGSQPVAYYYAMKSYSAPVDLGKMPDGCPLSISGPVHPLVARIIQEDCGSPRLKPYFEYWQNKGKRQMENFLKLTAQARQPDPKDKAKHFADVFEALRQYDLPQIWAAVVMQENKDFNPFVNSKGFWQIIASTKKWLGFSSDKQVDVKTSTELAATYYNWLLSQPSVTNIKSALVAYNVGIKTLEASSKARSIGDGDIWGLCDSLERDKESKADNEIYFWKNKTCSYVPKIISAMLVSLDPKSFGMADMEPLEGK